MVVQFTGTVTTVPSKVPHSEIIGQLGMSAYTTCPSPWMILKYMIMSYLSHLYGLKINYMFL